MKFCQAHWDKMRAAVEARGLTPLVAPDREHAIANVIDEIEQGKQTLDNFDPLMSMHWNIAGNLMELLGRSFGYLLSCREGDEDPIDVTRIEDYALKAKFIGKKWPLCPICYANIAHEISCDSKKCNLAKSNGYDICIEWSADAVKENFEELMSTKES